MTPHPHAEVLRAIADGVPLSEFEHCHASWKSETGWSELTGTMTFTLIDPGHMENYKFRRKPQYIMVNGFKVPKPLDVIPKDMEYFFYPTLDAELLYQKDTWTNHSVDTRVFNRKLCHATKDAAIAHAKAMLGIDPEYFK